MAKGEHIYVQNSVHGVPFQHHGIDMGDGTVIHLAPASGARVALKDKSDEFAVRRDSLEDFHRGSEVLVFEHADARSPDTSAEAAEAALGQTGYSLLEGNCEHFATLCATGRWESQQIEMSEATVAALASMATKAAWSMSARFGAKTLLRSASKVHPAAMLADGVELATLMAGCRSGLSAEKSRQVARLSGTVAAAGIGTLFGGPAGAALFVAAHTSSGALADQMCKGFRRLLS